MILIEPVKFLKDFHNRSPGLSPVLFSDLLVDKQKSSYDLISNLATSNSNPGEVVLDLACGDGYLLERISRLDKGLRLVGIDISEKELEIASERLKENSANFIQCDARSLPLATQSVNSIVCHMALMLVNPIGEALREISRVLTPGGKFYAVISAHGSTAGLLPTFMRCLQSACKRENISPIVFSEDKLHNPETAFKLFNEHFSGLADLSVQKVELKSPIDSASAWTKLTAMYDFSRLSDYNIKIFRDDFLNQAELLESTEELNELIFPACLITATKADGA